MTTPNANPALTALVTEALILDARIKSDSDRLAAIRAELVTAAAGVDTKFPATETHGATVVHPAPRLIKVETKDLLSHVKEIAGKNFPKLFWPIWAQRKGFREIAAALLGKDAPKLIRLVEAPSSPRVTFGEF